MQTTNVNENEFYDMFNIPQANGASGQSGEVNENSFRLSETETDIFKLEKEQQQQQQAGAEGDEANNGAESQENTEGKEGGEETDDNILFQHDEDIKKAGRKPKYNFQDATGYFEDRIKAGKFVPLEIENEKGEAVPFIPKSPEDYDEFIDFQVTHKLGEKAEQLEKTWMQDKSPAFQYLAEYADKISHPSQLLPFIQGIDNIDSINGMNETELDGAETIYRTWLKQRGEPTEVIDRQVEMAKTANQLVDLAKSYKPVLIQKEQTRLAELDKQETDRNQRAAIQIFENEQKAIEAIEAPIFGKQKLKDDEKNLVYQMIGRPVKELGGYAIYNEIDKLFANKDFAALREVALMLGKKDTYLKYASVQTAQGVAAGAMRTLKVATESNKSGSETNQAEPKPTYQQARQPQSASSGFRRY